MFVDLFELCHGRTVFGTCESQVKVNCVEAGLALLDACFCKRLTFSLPDETIGFLSALAFAMEREMIPGDSAFMLSV